MVIYDSTYLSISMFIASVLACVVILLAWRRRTVSGGMEFILLMAAVAVYAFFAALEVSATTIPLKITWSKLSYLGVVNLAPCWLLFSLTYFHRKQRVNRHMIVMFWVVPLITLGLAFANERFGLIWTSFTFASTEPGSLLVYGHGIGFWIHAAYAYLLMLAGTYWLIRSAWHAPHLFQWQMVVIIIASLIPWTGNMLYIFNLAPWHGLDLTPIAFVVSGFLLVVSLYWFHTFDLIPVAREIVFNSLGAGILVLDNQNRLVDINPLAKQWTNLDDKSISCKLFDVLQLGEEAQQYQQTSEAQAVLETGEGENRRILNLTISPILDTHGELQGRVALIQDNSTERSLRETEHRYARQIELLNSITLLTLSYPELPNMYQILADRLGELFDADGAYLTLWDDEQQCVIPTAAYGNLRESYPDIAILPGEKTMTESVLLAGHVLVAEDTYNTPYMSPRIAAFFPTHSSMALPLIANGKKLGAVIVSFHQIHRFTPSEIALGEQAAGQIALAIDKVWMYDAEHRRNAQLSALQSVSRAIASSLDLNQIFKTVVKELQDTFGYPYVSIYLLHGDKLRLGAQLGYPEELIFWEIPVDRGVLGRTIRSQQTQFIKDVSTDPEFLRATYDVGSEISVPLLNNRTVLGTLNIESPAHKPLTEKDVQLLISFADQVTVAINNANLFLAEQKQHKLTGVLREMGMAMSESLNLDSVLNNMLEGIQRVVPYDRARVMLMDKEHMRAVTARLQIRDQLVKEFAQKTIILQVEVANSPHLLQMIETGKPLIVTDLSANPGWAIDPGSRDFHSSVGVPITLQSEVIGFLLLEKIAAHFYSPEHAQTLVSFASQAAIAVANARLFEIERRRRQEAAAIAEVGRDISASLHLDIVLERIARYAKDMLNAETSAVYLCVPTMRILQANAAIGPDAEEIKQDPVIIGEGILGNIALQQTGEVVNYTINDPRAITIEGTEDIADEHIIGVPVLLGDQLTGLIAVWRIGTEEEFKLSDLDFLSNLALQAGIAIQNARLYAEAKHTAVIDELTGIYNRRGLFEVGKKELERSIRFKHSLVALFLDIDHFKDFNDTYSYAVGDQVLRLFAHCLQSNLREFDLIGRYGGEEFVVLLPETEMDMAGEVAERIRVSVAALKVHTDLGETSITVSIGVCATTPKLLDLQNLIDQAGQGLHLAKQGGRNRVAIAKEYSNCVL